MTSLLLRGALTALSLAAAANVVAPAPAFADPPGMAAPAQPGTPVPAAPTMSRADSAPAAARADSRKSLDDSVRAAVVESESRLGKLEPWQKKIFDDEVVPQCQKFVRDFSGTSAIVDVDSIRNYLRFYGPTAFHGSNHKILVYFRTAPGCDACALGKDRIQADVKGRLERRGLEPVWLTSEDADGQGISGGPRQIADRVVSAAHAQGESAALTLLIDPVAVDDLDSAHADEKHYLIRSTLDLRDIGREEGQIDVLDPEPFEAPVARLMNTAFTDAGVKLAQQPDLNTPGGNEVRIEVRGTGDFATYAHARDALADKLKSDGSLEEREITRGRAVFALVTSRSPASVRKDLNGVAIENGALALVPGGAPGSVSGASAPASASPASAPAPAPASDASAGGPATGGAVSPDDGTILMEVHQ